MANVTDNTAAGRYEMIEADQVAYADYRLEGGRLIIDHVFTPPPLRGAGTAGVATVAPTPALGAAGTSLATAVWFDTR